MLIVPDMSVEPGADVHIDIKVKNFQEITGTQFSLNWNPDVLEFSGTDNFGLPDLSLDGNFGLSDVDEGKIRFAWYQNDLSGVTLEDMSTIFSIWFKAVGALNESTQLMITDDPIVVEVVDTEGEAAHQVQNGTITIGSTNSVTTTSKQGIRLLQNNPNPFTDLTYVEVESASAVKGTLSVYDNSGKSIYSIAVDLRNGLNRIPLSRTVFGSAGSYYYTLETPKSYATRKLSVQ
jgi:hypothetical protein